MLAEAILIRVDVGEQVTVFVREDETVGHRVARGEESNAGPVLASNRKAPERRMPSGSGHWIVFDAAIVEQFGQIPRSGRRDRQAAALLRGQLLRVGQEIGTVLAAETRS